MEKTTRQPCHAIKREKIRREETRQDKTETNAFNDVTRNELDRLRVVSNLSEM